MLKRDQQEYNRFRNTNNTNLSIQKLQQEIYYLSYTVSNDKN